MASFDICVSCTPPFGDAAIGVLRAALAAGVPAVDLGVLGREMLEAVMAFNEHFEKAGLIYINGLGSSPGTMNLLSRFLADRVDTLESLELAFAHADLYTPSRPMTIPFLGALWEFSSCPTVYRNHQWEVLPPRALTQEIAFPDPAGVRTCFAIGHPEIFTLPESLKDKGLKDVVFLCGFTPEFYEQGVFLAEIGLAGTDPIKVGDVEVVPMDVVEACYANLPPEQNEIKSAGLLRVKGWGSRGQDYVEMTATMKSYPYFGLLGTAHRTSAPAAVGARMIVRGEITARGVLPPERCVDPVGMFRELTRWQLEFEFTEVSRLGPGT